MCMTGQKLQLHLLQGRSGGTEEPVRVEDERVENENQTDGTGPDKEMVEAGWGGGGKGIEQCDGDGDSGGGGGGDGDDDSLEDVDIHNARITDLGQSYTSPRRHTRTCGGPY